jgi:outer membrane lipoprotein
MPRPAATVAACLLLLLMAACATVVPPELASQVDKGLTLTKVRMSPAATKGKIVLWGGRIIRTINKPKGTLFEVLQVPLDMEERPKKSYDSEGRFIVSMSGFFDPEIYHKGRDLTVVGQVAGVENLPIGETKYKYVLLRGKEIKLWEPRPQYPRSDMPRFDFGLGAGPGSYWWGRPYGWW